MGDQRLWSGGHVFSISRELRCSEAVRIHYHAHAVVIGESVTRLRGAIAALPARRMGLVWLRVRRWGMFEGSGHRETG